MFWLISSLALVASCALLGCSSAEQPLTGGSGDGSAGESGAAGAGSAPVGSAVGTFTFTLVAAAGSRPAYTSLLGRVYESAVPAAVTWTETARVGECSLLEPSIPFCSPSCDVSEVCVADARCEAYPALLDTGQVTVTGLGPSFDVKPIAGSYQLAGGKTLPSPPCDEGAAFSLAASGGDLAAFELAGTGIAPLVLTGAEQLPFNGGEPLLLEWEPAREAGTRVSLRVDVSHHGGTKGLITCDVDDDGSAEIAAELADGLISLGTAGFPALRAQRRAQTSQATAGGRMTLEIVSAADRALEIDGVVSCASSQDCPAGTACQSDRACH